MAEEVGAVESPQPESIDVSETSTDELRGMMTQTEPPAAEQPESPETETEKVPEGLEPTETEEERLAKRRIRPKSALDQQVLDLYKSEAFEGSFADASRIIYQQPSQQNLQPVQQAPADDSPDPVDQYDEQTSKIREEITTLEAQVDEAADNLDTAEALKLQREVTRREMDIQVLMSTKERELERRKDYARNTHRNKAMESRDRALQTFPELQDKEAIPRKQFDEYVRQVQGDPDYSSVFESPMWPEIMAREFAAKAGLQQQQQQQQMPQAPPQQAPAMGTQAQVLTSGATTQPANAPVTEQQVAANMGQMSNDQLYALLGQADGRRAPLR